MPLIEIWATTDSGKDGALALTMLVMRWWWLDISMGRMAGLGNDVVWRVFSLQVS